MTSQLRLSVFLAILILVPLLAGNVLAMAYDISGTVVDTDGQPMPDVCMILMGNNSVLTTYTDQSGYYGFPGTEGGTRYTLSACKYLPSASSVVDPSPGSGDAIMAIAEAELGNTDGPSPGRYHGHDGAWCSEFVSWAYWQAGDPFTGGTTDGGACTEDWNMSTVYRIQAGFARNEDWQLIPTCEIASNWSPETQAALMPQPGDYVLFSNTTGIDRSHSGLVWEIQGDDMLTIEGNVSNLVKTLTRRDWLIDQVGNTIVAGIGYRRRVSRLSFSPAYHYDWLNSPLVMDFVAEYSIFSEPGDANGDGYVNSDDLNIVRGHWGESVSPGDAGLGDLSGDGIVTSDDLNLVRANWGNAYTAVVPEPGMFALASFGLLILGFRLKPFKHPRHPLH